ncbi:GntR family transcriptional regulator [Pseudonocardia lutea]|uniref:GntR family transcriptional regulator n=1 Tax=Pseudonocardia lutea TaxID=2172015 RepID=A0ABW1IFD2_9PSEU
MLADPGRATLPGPDAARLKNVLCHQVLSGLHAPGARLCAAQVERSHHVSAADVRDAFAALAAEGLLRLTGDDAVVPHIDAARLAEVDEVRRGLQEVTIRRFVRRASPAQRAAVRAAAERFRTLVDSAASSPAALREAYEWFYYLLLRAAGGRNTVDLLLTLREEIGLTMATGLHGPGRAASVADELNAIVAAMEANDVARAVEVADAHLDALSRSALHFSRAR